MKVSELIKHLQDFPADLDVLTNQCEATSTHEDISEVETVKVVYKTVNKFGMADVEAHVYVGTGPAR